MGQCHSASSTDVESENRPPTFLPGTSVHLLHRPQPLRSHADGENNGTGPIMLLSPRPFRLLVSARVDTGAGRH